MSGRYRHAALALCLACAYGGGPALAQTGQDQELTSIDLCLDTSLDARHLMETAQGRGFAPFLEAPEYYPSPPDQFVAGGRSPIPGGNASLAVQTSRIQRPGELAVQLTVCGVIGSQGHYLQIDQRLVERLGPPRGPYGQRSWTLQADGDQLLPLTAETRGIPATSAVRVLPPGRKLVVVTLSGDNAAAAYEVRTYEVLD